MPVNKNILIDLCKLKNIYTGLGEVSWQFGQTLSANSDSSFDFTYLLPDDYTGKFGTSVQYDSRLTARRYFPNFFRPPAIWHAIHQDSAYMPPGGTPYLLTIHDLNFLLEKTPSKAKRRLKILQKKIDRASALAFVSRYTELVADSHLRIDVPTRVIYNGVAQYFEKERSVKPAFMNNKSGRFYFTIGVVKDKKNFHVLIDMMQKIEDGILVIAGDNSDPYAHQMMNTIEAKKLADRILMPGTVSPNEKQWLYENCSAFFFPSRIEGFGIPVIEAMSYGKPVFLSDLTSLPEIAGGEGYYWKEFHPEKMAEVYYANVQSMNDPGKVRSRKKRAAQFSWENNVKEYIDYYRFILNEVR